MSAPVINRVRPVASPRGVAPSRVHRRHDPRLPASRLPPSRFVDGTECRGSGHQRSSAGSGVASTRVFARRRASAGILVGAVLAGLVWVFVIVGGDYEAASAPDPVATSVVHVRGGETLHAVAARVAPDVPRQAVINQLRALNGMTSVTLTVGQALVVPVYR